MKRLLLTLTASILLSTLWAQSPQKFGKTTIKDLEMKSYKPDPQANAVVLADFGRSYFKYSAEKGFQYVFERKRRVKIFNKEGFDHANFQIPFYQTNRAKEEIGSLKGTTYNLENGKMTKTKMTRDAIFEEQVSENWYLQKITLPNVQEGSVIEYSYTITSDFVANFREWYFQSTIPIKWSQYDAKIPEFFKYQQIIQGYEPLAITDQNIRQETFDIDYATLPQQGGKVDRGSYGLESASTEYVWAAENMPALREEPYITTLEDYFTRIEFELSMIKYPNSPPKPYMGDYLGLNKQFLDHDKFGDGLNRTNFLEDRTSLVLQGTTDPAEKMIKIYHFVQNHMEWNGQYRKYLTSTLKRSFESKIGSSSDINLLLVAMLRQGGLKADPVILSTRSHGRIHPVFPFKLSLIM